MEQKRDIQILRDLAKQFIEITGKEIQKERRDLWRKHNGLVRTRTPVLVRMFMAWNEIYPDKDLKCQDPLFREQERYIRQMLFQDTLKDDYVIEPWVTVNAAHDGPFGLKRWGPALESVRSQEADRGWVHIPPIKEPEDIIKLVKPWHKINEEKTREKYGRICDAIGDIVDVHLDRGPVFWYFAGDISTDLAALRGLEQIMWDMYDQPDWLHQMAAFMRDGIMAVHDQAESLGDWSLCNHENQSMPYATELEDPKPNSENVSRSKLWAYMASQEFALISPELFDEFLLQYQMPILEKFGLVSYGCCEDLTKKIKYLKKIKNLRRIAVTPWADTKSCAEQIGEDYVVSWRPSPAETICLGFEPERVRDIVKKTMKDFKENKCHVDITLKDVKTVRGKPEDLKEWVRVVREALDE